MARILSYEERRAALENIAAELARLVQGHRNLSDIVEKSRKNGTSEVLVEAMANARLTELEDLADQIRNELTGLSWVHQVTLQVGAPEQFKFAQLLNTYDNSSSKRAPYGPNMCRILVDAGDAGFGFDDAEFMNILSVLDGGDLVELEDAEDKDNKQTYILNQTALPEHIDDPSCFDFGAWSNGGNWSDTGGNFTNAVCIGGASDLLTPDMAYELEEGRCYQVTWDFTLTTGAVAFRLRHPTDTVNYISKTCLTDASFYFQCPFAGAVINLLPSGGGTMVLNSLSVKAIDTLLLKGATSANITTPGTTEEDTHILPVQNTEDSKFKLVLKDRGV